MGEAPRQPAGLTDARERGRLAVQARGWGLGWDRRLRRRCRRGWRSRCTLDPPGRGLAPLEAVNLRARRLTALGARGTPGRGAGGARWDGGGVGVRLRLRGRREGLRR